jgi:hypothetical protein
MTAEIGAVRWLAAVKQQAGTQKGSADTIAVALIETGEAAVAQLLPYKRVMLEACLTGPIVLAGSVVMTAPLAASLIPAAALEARWPDRFPQAA